MNNRIQTNGFQMRTLKRAVKKNKMNYCATKNITLSMFVRTVLILLSQQSTPPITIFGGGVSLTSPGIPEVIWHQEKTASCLHFKINFINCVGKCINIERISSFEKC